MNKCVERMRDIHSMFSYPCGKTAKVEDSEGWHCGIHCDEAKAKRKAKSDASYELKKNARDAMWKQRGRGVAAQAAMEAYRDRFSQKTIWRCDFCGERAFGHAPDCKYLAWDRLGTQ